MTLTEITELRIEIPSLPPRELSPNVKYNWQGKKRIKDEWQNQVAWAIHLALGDWDGPLWDKAELTIEHVIDGRANKPYDPDNCLSWHKSTIDVFKPVGKTNPYGMGIIVGDSPKHLTVKPPIQTIDKDRAPRVILSLVKGG